MNAQFIGELLQTQKQIRTEENLKLDQSDKDEIVTSDRSQIRSKKYNFKNAVKEIVKEM